MSLNTGHYQPTSSQGTTPARHSGRHSFKSPCKRYWLQLCAELVCRVCLSGHLLSRQTRARTAPLPGNPRASAADFDILKSLLGESHPVALPSQRSLTASFVPHESRCDPARGPLARDNPHVPRKPIPLLFLSLWTTRAGTALTGHSSPPAPATRAPSGTAGAPTGADAHTDDHRHASPPKRLIGCRLRHRPAIPPVIGHSPQSGSRPPSVSCRHWFPYPLLFVPGSVSEGWLGSSHHLAPPRSELSALRLAGRSLPLVPRSLMGVLLSPLGRALTPRSSPRAPQHAAFSRRSSLPRAWRLCRPLGEAAARASGAARRGRVGAAERERRDRVRQRRDGAARAGCGGAGRSAPCQRLQRRGPRRAPQRLRARPARSRHPGQRAGSVLPPGRGRQRCEGGGGREGKGEGGQGSARLGSSGRAGQRLRAGLWAGRRQPAGRGESWGAATEPRGSSGLAAR